MFRAASRRPARSTCDDRGMTTPDSIDVATWARRETFEYYRHQVPCTYAITVEIVRITPDPCAIMCRDTAFAVTKFVCRYPTTGCR